MNSFDDDPENMTADERAAWWKSLVDAIVHAEGENAVIIDMEN